MFSADECFGGRQLNRGIELCAVVEQMYSTQALFRTFGDPGFLDRCERIAYVMSPLPRGLLCICWLGIIMLIVRILESSPFTFR